MTKFRSLSVTTLFASTILLTGCSFFSSKPPRGLPKGVDISITSYGGLQTTGNLPANMSVEFDNYGRIHLKEGQPIVHSQYDDTQERIEAGFESPVSGISSEWPIYLMKTGLNCSNELDKSETEHREFVSPISQSKGATSRSNLLDGISLTNSGNVFIDYTGRSHFVFGFFANGLGVKTGSLIFTPKLAPMDMGSYQFYLSDHITCLGHVSLLPGPKMVTYLAWLHNNGRYPARTEGEERDDTNPNFHDPINPLHGGYGKAMRENMEN